MPEEGQDKAKGDTGDEGQPKRRRRRTARERNADSPQGGLGPFEDAHLTFLRRIGEAWSPTEPQQRLGEALNAYLTNLTRTQGQDVGAIERAYREYVNAARELQDPDRIRQAYERAFREYGGALQQAWAEADPAVLDPASLAAIGQAVSTAAALVAAVTGESAARP